MINKIFVFNDAINQVELNTPEILLVKEFSALMDNRRNICEYDKTGELKLRAFREFTYIWLAIDFQSVYADYSEQERHIAAMQDAGLTEEEFNDPTFRAACRKYKQLLESNRSLRLLKAAQNKVEDYIDYFNNISDLNERDANGKPIFKATDSMKELTSLHKVVEELEILETSVKKELTEVSKVRAGDTDGFMPTEF